MLIIRRRAGESISIGDDIEIEIVELGSARVKIGIRAPREVPVRRKEVSTVRDRNLAAAALGPDIRTFLAQNLSQLISDQSDKTFKARYTGHPEAEENPGPA
jgi:carbon storage regulator